MNRTALAFTALGLAAPVTAHADKSPTAYADAVHEVTTDHYRGWIIGKLTTWKVGTACWEKIQDKEGRIVSLASFLTREVAEYAKQVTGLLVGLDRQVQLGLLHDRPVREVFATRAVDLLRDHELLREP